MAMNRNARFWTKECYPDKMDVEEFVEEIRNSLGSFEKNISRLVERGSFPETLWAEDWIETLAAWMEMGREDTES